MSALPTLSPAIILSHLLLAGLMGAIIGYERRMRHKAIGVAGMMLVAMGSTTFMLVARHLAPTDPQAPGRAVQGLMQGIGFLGGAVIFKGGTDVRGIKSAAAIWITGAIGLSIGVDQLWLGAIMGVATAGILFIADSIPRPPAQQEQDDDISDRAYGKVEK